MYRDLKPENIVMSRNGYLKIIDFGLTKPSSELEPHSVEGTLSYMSPEMLKGREYSFSTDFWSLGCVIYEMITGLPPFISEDPEELKDIIICEEPQYSGSMMSMDAMEVVAALLEKNPKRRPDFEDLKEMDWF